MIHYTQTDFVDFYVSGSYAGIENREGLLFAIPGVPEGIEKPGAEIGSVILVEKETLCWNDHIWKIQHTSVPYDKLDEIMFVIYRE